MLVLFVFWTGLLKGFNETVSFVFSVFIVYVIVNIVSWHLNKKEATKVNKLLKHFQEDKVR